MSFYSELIEVESALTKKGFSVRIPVSAQKMKLSGDFDPTHFKGGNTNKQRAIFIKENFKQIIESDAILVINGNKNGVRGYIGANVLMEIAFAFYFDKKIYIWHKISDKV